MTIYLDPRAGSQQLLSALRSFDVAVDSSRQLDADVEFLAWGPDGPMLAGIEYKLLSTGDMLTSMTDGRLTGTQLPRMMAAYQRLYLLVEGPRRVDDEGVLEISPRAGMWVAAHGRKGEGWTAHEYWSRLESIREFFTAAGHDVRIIESHNRRESAHIIVTLYRYWQKSYSEHASYRQRDHSNSSRQHAAPQARADMLFGSTTSNLPLCQRWAEELPGIGIGKGGYVAQHFGQSPGAMVMGDAAEWRRVTFMEKLKRQEGYRRTHLSKERAAEIVAAMWPGKDREKES